MCIKNENFADSGLLECPLTTRTRKVIQANYIVKSSGPTCGDMTIATAAECFQAASKLLPNTTITTTAVSNGSVPTGCSVERDATGKIGAVRFSLFLKLFFTIF